MGNTIALTYYAVENNKLNNKIKNLKRENDKLKLEIIKLKKELKKKESEKNAEKKLDLLLI